MNKKINEKVAKLLDSNRVLFDDKLIAFDGVVDEETFAKSRVKIAFLLKEVNENKSGRSADWRCFLEDVKREALQNESYKTWRNVCLWIEAFNNKDVSFMDCVDETSSEFDKERLSKNILEVAIVNINKAFGGGSSDYENLKKIAEDCKELLEEEIEDIIKPELVICGGTFEFAKIICGIKNSEVKVFGTGTEYFIHNNILYLQFVHPGWFSVNRKILFSYAKSVFAEVRKILKNL